MIRRIALLALGGGILAGAALADGVPEGFPAGDPAAGRKVAGICRTCHGIDGLAKIPIAPNIGGERADYLTRQLLAFRSGTRTHEMMSVVAAGLKDQDIADVTAWYASHQARATVTRDPAQAPELCSGCHGVDGISVLEAAPNLAGEGVVYIDTQIKAFRTGKRTHEIMSAIAADLTDQEIRAAGEWYASVKLEILPPQ